MHEDFMATVYPKVHESLKHTTEEHVLIENPPSSTGTLSSMKNLDDAFTFGDQFINDKSIEEDPGKANVECEVKSKVTIPIHQASSSAHPLSTPVIDLSPLKPVSPPAQEPIITATTTTTTTLTLPLPLQQQNTTDHVLASHVSELEKIGANFEKRHKIQDKTVQALSSRVYMLENHDLDFFEVQMKEILHDRMFESGSYKSHPDHKALYEVLEVSMDRGNREEFIEAKDKSRKRCHDDKDPPPPSLKDSDRSKKKKHDSTVSASKQPPIQTSSACKTSNIRKPPSSSSKQQPAS
ncbi:hypothetical protein Tco_0651003 [Tanacetum coccineum]